MYLILNGNTYTKRQLKNLSNQTHQTAWQQSFWNFIKSWLDEKTYVEVKTSGSTGTPKIIRLEKKKNDCKCESNWRFFQFETK